MKHIRLLTAPLFVLGLLLAGSQSAAQTPNIGVAGADAVLTWPVTESEPLGNTLGGVIARVSILMANAARKESLGSPPETLQTALSGVFDRVLMQQANASIRRILASPPGALATRLNGVSPRLLLLETNHGLHAGLHYPSDLVKDVTPPTLRQMSHTRTTVRWSTDEFTTGVVHYGLQSGVYIGSAVSELFALEHEVTLPTAPPGKSYYFVIFSTDLSGNSSTSAEYQLQSQFGVFLPVLVRQTR